MTPVSLLLMIVSIAIAVLPVWRSPMISSRWPRPIGIIASIAFRPVCIGSLTGWGWTTPRGLNSARRGSLGLFGPLAPPGRAGLARTDRALAVQRRAERGDDAAEQLLADRDLEQAVGALDRVALDDLLPLAEQHGADVVGLEVERQADDVMRQLEHLERHAVLQAVDARDAVADREDGPDLGQLRAARVEPLDAALEDAGDLVGLDLHVSCLLLGESPAARRARPAFSDFPGGCGSRRRGWSSPPARRCHRGRRDRPCSSAARGGRSGARSPPRSARRPTRRGSRRS